MACARRSQAANRSANISAALWGETLNNEARASANSLARPAKRTVLPPPPHHTRFVETSGLERSLSTNIPDHPTAIQARRAPAAPLRHSFRPSGGARPRLAAVLLSASASAAHRSMV